MWPAHNAPIRPKLGSLLDMTAIHPNPPSADSFVVEKARVAVYWFDAERQLRRKKDDEFELPASLEQVFDTDPGTLVRPMHNAVGEVIGIATRMR